MAGAGELGEERAIETLQEDGATDYVLKTDLARARRELFATIGVLEPTPDGVVLRGQTDDLTPEEVDLLASASFDGRMFRECRPRCAGERWRSASSWGRDFCCRPGR